MSNVLEKLNELKSRETISEEQERQHQIETVVAIAIRDFKGEPDESDPQSLLDLLFELEWTAEQYREIVEEIPRVIRRFESIAETNRLKAELPKYREELKALLKRHKAELLAAHREVNRREPSGASLANINTQISRSTKRFPFLYASGHEHDANKAAPRDEIKQLIADEAFVAPEPPTPPADEPKEPKATTEPPKGKSGNRTPSAADLPTAQRK